MSEFIQSTKGNDEISLLPAVAIVGARNASNKALRVAERLGVRFGEDMVNVVSGYANGIDTAAHKGALQSGTTTCVLPFGINHAKLKKELKGLVNEKNTLYVSQWKDYLPFSGQRAMQRNGTILDLVRACIIVEAGLPVNGKGSGSFAMGQLALRRKKRVYVVDPSDLPGCLPGNAELIKLGAIPVRLSEIAERGVRMFMTPCYATKFSEIPKELFEVYSVHPDSPKYTTIVKYDDGTHGPKLDRERSEKLDEIKSVQGCFKRIVLENGKTLNTDETLSNAMSSMIPPPNTKDIGAGKIKIESWFTEEGFKRVSPTIFKHLKNRGWKATILQCGFIEPVYHLDRYQIVKEISQ